MQLCETDLVEIRHAQTRVDERDQLWVISAGMNRLTAGTDEEHD